MRATRERAGEAVDDVTTALLGTLAQLTAHATSPAPASGAARIDRIAVLEQLRSAIAAAQHAEMVAFGRQQVEEQIALVEAGRLDPVALGRGIADQIALACRVSPFRGSRRLGIARALDSDLPVSARCSPQGGSANGSPRSSAPRPRISIPRSAAWWTSSSPRAGWRSCRCGGPRA